MCFSKWKSQPLPPPPRNATRRSLCHSCSGSPNFTVDVATCEARDEARRSKSVATWRPPRARLAPQKRHVHPPAASNFLTRGQQRLSLLQNARARPRTPSLGKQALLEVRPPQNRVEGKEAGEDGCRGFSWERMQPPRWQPWKCEPTADGRSENLSLSTLPTLSIYSLQNTPHPSLAPQGKYTTGSPSTLGGQL